MVVLAKVDATDDASKDLAAQFKIESFPTLKFFKNGDTGKPVDYVGERDKDSIVAWIKKRMGDASKIVDSAEALVGSDADGSVIGAFKDDKTAWAFDQVAQDDDEHKFFKTRSESSARLVLEKYSAAAGKPTVLVFRSFDKNPATTTDGTIISDVDKLKLFIQDSSEPPSKVGRLSAESLKEKVASGVHLVEFYAPWRVSFFFFVLLLFREN